MEAQPFVVEEYVRWSDVDYAGIIFYGAYIRFFEFAETELFRAAAVPYGVVFDRFDMWLPRAHLDCDFMHPARLDDRLKVAAYFTRFGRSSIATTFDVTHVETNRLTAVGHQVLVCTDRTTLKPREVPGPLRAMLRPFTLSEDAARQQLGVSLPVKR